MVRWDNRKKRVVIEMTWEDARDFANWLIMEHPKDSFGKDLWDAAKEGAGFWRELG